MVIEHKSSPLYWGALDISLFGIQKDWEQNPLEHPAAFGLAIDHENFWFITSHKTTSNVHPDAEKGAFTPELWKYDVAEFFMRHPETGCYLEFNLAANGAWWAAEFTDIRKRTYQDDIEMPGVKTFSDTLDDGTWISAAKIPLDILRSRIGFGETTEMNVSFIINSPKQQFLSASPPHGEKPDFHQTELFKQVKFHKS